MLGSSASMAGLVEQVCRCKGLLHALAQYRSRFACNSRETVLVFRLAEPSQALQALEGLLLRYTALVPQPHRQTPNLFERMARSSVGSTAQVTQRVRAAPELTPHLLASPSWGAGSAATPSAAAEALTGALSCGALTGRSHAADGWSGGSGSSPAQAPGAFQLGWPLATAHRRQGARGAAAIYVHSLRVCDAGQG